MNKLDSGLVEYMCLFNFLPEILAHRTTVGGGYDLIPKRKCFLLSWGTGNYCRELFRGEAWNDLCKAERPVIDKVA
jgi:hypothetical protein